MAKPARNEAEAQSVNWHDWLAKPLSLPKLPQLAKLTTQPKKLRIKFTNQPHPNTAEIDLPELASKLHVDEQ